MSKERIADLVRLLIAEIGEDPNREGLRDTPERVAELYSEIFAGYAASAELEVSFAEESRLVALHDIEFYSVCEHHLLPFFGKAHIVYEPNGRVYGASKIVRLIEKFTRRLQVQERITSQIAEELVERGAKGSLVILEAEHLCMKMRGVRNGGSLVTSAECGSLQNAALRAEALQIMGGYAKSGWRGSIQARRPHPEESIATEEKTLGVHGPRFSAVTEREPAPVEAGVRDNTDYEA